MKCDRLRERTLLLYHRPPLCLWGGGWIHWEAGGGGGVIQRRWPFPFGCNRSHAVWDKLCNICWLRYCTTPDLHLCSCTLLRYISTSAGGKTQGFPLLILNIMWSCSLYACNDLGPREGGIVNVWCLKIFFLKGAVSKFCRHPGFAFLSNFCQAKLFISWKFDQNIISSVTHLYPVCSCQELFSALGTGLRCGPSLASMDLRKRAWSVCAVVGLVLVVGERE